MFRALMNIDCCAAFEMLTDSFPVPLVSRILLVPCVAWTDRKPMSSSEIVLAVLGAMDAMAAQASGAATLTRG